MRAGWIFKQRYLGQNMSLFIELCGRKQTEEEKQCCVSLQLTTQHTGLWLTPRAVQQSALLSSEDGSLCHAELPWALPGIPTEGYYCLVLFF